MDKFVENLPKSSQQNIHNTSYLLRDLWMAKHLLGSRNEKVMTWHFKNLDVMLLYTKV